jgi:hypothetical protein
MNTIDGVGTVRSTVLRRVQPMQGVLQNMDALTRHHQDLYPGLLCITILSLCLTYYYGFFNIMARLHEPSGPGLDVLSTWSFTTSSNR